ncbi:MAG: hypothetical protein ABF651_01040 [Sporolactobacillus sp.]
MRRDWRGFIASASILTGIFLIAVNLLTHGPALWINDAIILFLLSLIGWYRGTAQKIYSLFISLVFIAACLINNWIESSDVLWTLYVLPAALMIPVSVFLKKRLGQRLISLLGASMLIGYYIMINVWYSPVFPWSLLTTFAILWWPFACWFGKRIRLFAVLSAVMITLTVSLVNYLVTPQTIWAVYPIFVILWWPLSVYDFGSLMQKSDKKKRKFTLTKN